MGVVNTGKVAGRRKLRFESFQDVIDDATTLATRPYRQLGNWSLGQACRHLAITLNSTIDGGIPIRPALAVRLVLRLFKNRFIRNGMPAGFKLPDAAAKILEPLPVDDAEGIQELRRAVARIEREASRAPSPAFGQLSRADSDQLQLRHCELHLGFLVPA